jgi:hypothetical protein
MSDKIIKKLFFVRKHDIKISEREVSLNEIFLFLPFDSFLSSFKFFVYFI